MIQITCVSLCVGRVNTPLYKSLVPFVLDALEKRRRFEKSQQLRVTGQILLDLFDPLQSIAVGRRFMSLKWQIYLNEPFDFSNFSVAVSPSNCTFRWITFLNECISLVSNCHFNSDALQIQLSQCQRGLRVRTKGLIGLSNYCLASHTSPIRIVRSMWFEMRVLLSVSFISRSFALRRQCRRISLFCRQNVTHRWLLFIVYNLIGLELVLFYNSFGSCSMVALHLHLCGCIQPIVCRAHYRAATFSRCFIWILLLRSCARCACCEKPAAPPNEFMNDKFSYGHSLVHSFVCFRPAEWRNVHFANWFFSSQQYYRTQIYRSVCINNSSRVCLDILYAQLFFFWNFIELPKIFEFALAIA